MKKGIFFFRQAALYRYPVYSKIDSELDVTFYFCKKIKSNLKMLDYSKLSKVNLSLVEFNLPFGFYYLYGALKVNLKNYDYVFIAGDIRDISSWAILLKCRILKKPVYYWTHGFYGKEPFLICKIKKLYYTLGDDVFVYGQYSKRLMIQEGIKEKNIHVIYNSLDYDNHKILRNKLIRSDVYINIFRNTYPVIIFIGRLVESKKLEYLLKAQHELIRQNIIINVIFIGNGEEVRRLKIIAKHNKIDKYVYFHGSCYNEKEISKFIYNADICVSPGNIGLTAIHSLSFGTPVITHNQPKFQGPEFEAIIEGINGAFFDYNSISSLSETIKRWISLNPVKSNKIIDNCYRIIDTRYNPTYQIELLKRVLN